LASPCVPAPLSVCEVSAPTTESLVFTPVNVTLPSFTTVIV